MRDNNKLPFIERVLEKAREFPMVGAVQIDYGTAGFRCRAEILKHVMFRMGVTAALRSKVTKSTIGVMITASHNPEEDNGVKLVDPLGEMLDQSWEKHASNIANSSNEELGNILSDVVISENICIEQPSSVFLGRDTRKSSTELANAVSTGFEAVGGTLVDHGVVVTPMLHYMVACKNSEGQYGEPTHEGYYTKLSTSFHEIVNKKVDTGNYTKTINVDGSHGVGAFILKALMKYINPENLDILLFNDELSGILNHKSGADFVKTRQCGPENARIEAGPRYASFDGDADRLIYFYYDDELQFRMLDGDKIALLIAEHLAFLIKDCGLALNLGLVQTAYANGNSTNYITNKLGLPVVCTRTGVKHLHHEALKFDVGVYFEANGHGTVVFSQSARESIRAMAVEGEKSSCRDLASFMNLINSAVGDALSDMLVVEAVLHSKGWSIKNWDSMYNDLPNRLLTVKVMNRNAIKTSDAERKCVSPEGVQLRIDELVQKYPNGRSFIRPSGTEDLVRVFAEADSQTNADLLGYEVASVVYEFCHGVGPLPQKPNKSI